MPPTETLQELAKQHLMLHFSDMSVDPSEITVIERGEGYYVFDSEGNRYIDGLSGLYCANLGHSHGEEIGAAAAAQMAKLPFSSNWTVAHPSSIEAAAKIAELAPDGPRPRLLHLRRLGGGRVRLEDRRPVARRQRRAAAPQGDRPQGRLPRGHDGRPLDHRDAGLPDAVRAAADPDPPRLQHQRLPPPGRRGRGRPLPGAARGDRGDDRVRGRRDGGDDHRRAGAERRRLLRAPSAATGRGCGRSATGTGSCSSPTR